MKIGMIGLPNSGKTTIFNALTRAQVQVTPYSGAQAEPNLAVVDVGDERVLRLAEIYKPKKMTWATVEIVDFVAREGAFSGNLLGLIKTVDALALVVRNFKDDFMGPPTPLQDVETVEGELLLSDLIVAETRLERIEAGNHRGKKTPAVELEARVLDKVLAHLNAERPLRTLALSADEEKLLRGFQFLTQKPLMIILNSSETNFGKNQEVLAQLDQRYRSIEFAGSFEMELAQLDEQAAQMFMEDMGITASARDRLTQCAYEVLGYISFFTVGQDEVRAWNVCRGDTAVQAAGTIHSDLMRGFIRAECFAYDDLLACGSEKAVREHGRLRLEGKNYHVQDGDILSIRFNV
jgi:ribosome-binding ATPase